MTAVVTVKSQCKRISSHLKNTCPTKSRYSVNSSASKTCFVTRFSLIIQNRLHLLLKVLLNSKFIAKSTCRLTRSRNLESVSDIGLEVSFSRVFFICISESRISLPTGLGVSDLLSYRLAFRSRIFQSSRIQLYRTERTECISSTMNRPWGG